MLVDLDLAPCTHDVLRVHPVRDVGRLVKADIVVNLASRTRGDLVQRLPLTHLRLTIVIAAEPVLRIICTQGTLSKLFW